MTKIKRAYKTSIAQWKTYKELSIALKSQMNFVLTGNAKEKEKTLTKKNTLDYVF